MAAPCRRMASRPLVQLLSCFSRTALVSAGFRRFCSASLRTRSAVDRAPSPWTLMAAVCLQRLPVVSAELSPVERRFRRMIQQMEQERSLLSDHELQLLEDAERMSRKQADDYDSDEEEGRGDQEIVLAQDLEDSWEQKLKSFHPEPRVRDADEDAASVERCLADSLVLLAQQQVGDGKLWLLPQTRWQEGETLRQTAERALTSLPAAGLQATFLGNAPCGVYRYKLPRAARTEASVGVKVFFFKAVLADRGPPTAPDAGVVWARKSELPRYLTPVYMKKVDRFILDL